MRNAEFRQKIDNRQEPSKDDGIYLLERKPIIDMARRFRCEECVDEEVDVDVRTLDMDTMIKVTCRGCMEVIYLHDPTIFENGLRLRPATAGVVTHCMTTGNGLSGCEKMISCLNSDSFMKPNKYYEYSRVIGGKMLDFYEEQRPIVNMCVRNHYHQERLIEPDEDDILNVDVSFDGTWLTRGHNSNIGMGFVIEAETGFVLDFHVLSKYCQKCLRICKKYKDDEPRRLEEIHRHNLLGECLKNYEGTSGGMEKETAVRLWDRSVDKNKLRYTAFISDGDSSAYNAVVERDPYDGIEIEKEECVNHVAKRLGTRLRKLKKETFVETTTTTGKSRKMSTLGGKNKLTDEVIDRLTGYFGKAIRSSIGTTIEIMRKACLSGFKHVSSTDDNPDHEYCPHGENSHCFYNKALAKNIDPPSHETMRVKCRLPENDKKKVLAIYDDLSNDDLLRKCLSGRTQNPNESIHGKIWSKLQKTKHYGLRTVQYIAAMTVSEHNLGYESTNLISRLGFRSRTQRAIMVDKHRDSNRLRHSITPKSKKKKYAHVPQPDEDYGAGQH